MKDQMKDLRDDIAFMRALAEEGRSAPLLGGGILMAAGLIFGAASVAHWAVMVGALRVSPWAFSAIWISAGLGFGMLATLLGRRSKQQAGAAATVNRAARAVWSAVGWTIVVILVGMAIMAARLGQPGLMSLFPVIVLPLYGAAWSVASAMTRRGWMSAVAFGCYGSALGMAALGGHASTLLVYAASLVLFATVPGYLLLRQEPSHLV
ncbi:hypothetical protein [Caulobacter sp. B11]|uniref:hypothetical protein n=1 Tax=Caulobacter sp. B11 TaxID=2048899 RepID=UPI001F24DBD3|nr:hypothetical protein [Caulobacter sp. B11]